MPYLLPGPIPSPDDCNEIVQLMHFQLKTLWLQLIKYSTTPTFNRINVSFWRTMQARQSRSGSRSRSGSCKVHVSRNLLTFSKFFSKLFWRQTCLLTTTHLLTLHKLLTSSTFLTSKLFWRKNSFWTSNKNVWRPKMRWHQKRWIWVGSAASASATNAKPSCATHKEMPSADTQS